MPRKPKPEPVIMVVQRMSDGHEVHAGAFVDDFTGQPMVMVQDARTEHTLDNTTTLTIAKTQAKAQAYAPVIALLGPTIAAPFKRRF